MNSELFMKIRSDDLSEKVYERLKKAITTSIIKPGERIEINTLSNQWGVSRTPMKDAIARLSNEGLLEVKSKVGTYATLITTEDMLELFAIRLLLEGGISGEIIRYATEEQIERLEKMMELLEYEMAKGKDDFDYITFNHLDASFHEQLIEAAGNKKLLEVYRSLHFHAQVARYYYNYYDKRAEQTIVEHRDMIIAIRQKSEQKLEETIKKHIILGRAGLLNNSEIV